MDSFEIRKKFLNFFEGHNHKTLPSSSLIPQNDPTLLFVNAGMNQFKNIFLGLETPKYKEVTTIQKCLRAGGKHNDIDVVGQTPWHHTFFEMMGNFSFGTYFKEQAIHLAWEFLIHEIGFQKEHLWVSVFEDDEQSYKIWKNQQQQPEHKILRMGDKDNFWQMGDVGPCGPCSEIHYYAGDKKNPDPETDLVEVWNLVFMEFYDTEKGIREKLPRPCVDTGAGLERLSSLVQNKKSNYHTDLFKEIISDLENSCSINYDFTETSLQETQMAFRVLADHGRAVSFLINDGILPGSEAQSYVLRRIMRRAFYYGQKLSPKKNLLEKTAQSTIKIMSAIYPDLNTEKNLILSTIDEEFYRFSKNLESGRKKLFQKIKPLNNPFVDFEMAWDLYSTYGFPVDLTRLIVEENNYKMIDEKSFEKEKLKLEEKQKNNFQNKSQGFESFIQKLKPEHWKIKTEFTGYKTNQNKSCILYLFNDQNDFPSVDVLESQQEAWLVTKKTCFYPEGGGPIGDIGLIQTDTGKAKVLNCLKRNGVIFHKVKVMDGQLKTSTNCDLIVDSHFRSLIATSHTATHLLHACLRKTLGLSVRQAGSLVEPGYLRFDFSHTQAVTKKQLAKIENDVNDSIQNQEPLSSQILPYQKAIDEGALFLKGDPYYDDVRVITIGKDFSKELCGGIHVKNTKEIKDFKIITETGVQSGVRRISAFTGQRAINQQDDLKKQILELAQYLKINEKQCHTEQNIFLKWEQNIDQKIEALKNKIVNMKINSDKKTSPKPSKPLPIYDNFDRDTLVKHNLQLREHLSLSVQKETELANPFIAWVIKKQKQLSQLENQNQKMESFLIQQDDLIKNAKNFEVKGIKGHLVVVQLPLEDRKLLAQTTDQIKSKIPAVVVVAIGVSKTDIDKMDGNNKTDVDAKTDGLQATRTEIESNSAKQKNQKSYPIVVSVSKNLQKEILAGDLLKKQITGLLGGKGGGQAHFAQGTVTNLTKLPNLEDLLLEHFKSF